MLETARYQAKRFGTWAGGKGVIGTSNAAIKLLSPGFLQVGGAVATASAALGAGLTVVMAQLSFRHAREQLLNEYRTEISALTGKSVSELGQDDLRRAALGDNENGIAANPVIGEAFKRCSKSWWLKVGVGVLAGAATLGIVMVAAPALLVALGFGATGAAAVAAASTTAVWSAGAFTVSALQVTQLGLGVGIGFLTGQTLGATAEKATGLSKPCAEQKIRHLRRALSDRQQVTPEQVMEVYVAAHPEIGKQIAKTYGEAYEHLLPQDKQQIAAEYGPRFNLSGLTADLNHRQIRAGEIAFAAVGQQSGVLRLPEPPGDWRKKAGDYANQAYTKSRETLSHAWSKGREVVGRGLEEGIEKLGDAGRYLNSFRDSEVRGVALAPEKSAEHLAMLERVKGKWTQLVSQPSAANFAARG